MQGKKRNASQTSRKWIFTARSKYYLNILHDLKKTTNVKFPVPYFYNMLTRPETISPGGISSKSLN